MKSSVTFLDVVAAANKLPEVEVSTSYGTPSIKVRGKMIARMKEDGETLVLRTDFIARQILTQADPDAFYHHRALSKLPTGPGAAGFRASCRIAGPPRARVARGRTGTLDQGVRRPSLMRRCRPSAPN